MVYTPPTTLTLTVILGTQVGDPSHATQKGPLQICRVNTDALPTNATTCDHRLGTDTKSDGVLMAGGMVFCTNITWVLFGIGAACTTIPADCPMAQAVPDAHATHWMRPNIEPVLEKPLMHLHASALLEWGCDTLLAGQRT